MGTIYINDIMIYMYIRTVPDMSTDAPARICMKIKITTTTKS